MRVRSPGRLVCGLCFLSALAAQEVSAQGSLAQFELSVEVGQNIVRLDIYDAFTGRPLWGGVVNPTSTSPDVRFSTTGGAGTGDIQLDGDLFVLAFTPVSCGTLNGCTELRAAVTYAWAGDHAVLTPGTFYYAFPPLPIDQTDPTVGFTLNDKGVLDVEFVDAGISGYVNDALGDAGWTLPYDQKSLCNLATCSGTGPDEWFLSAGASTVGVPQQTGWSGPGEKLIPTFQFYGSVSIPSTWLNLTWAITDLVLMFTPGSSLAVNGVVLNVVGALMTAADPTSGWAGIAFSTGSGGGWSSVIVEWVAGTDADQAAVTVSSADPSFTNVEIRNAVFGTSVIGLKLIGSANSVATNLEIIDMTDRGILVNGGARLSLIYGLITGSNGDGIVASGTGAKVHLIPTTVGSGLRGPLITANYGGGVQALSSAEVRFGTSNPSSPGYGYATVVANEGRGLSAQSGADIYAGSGTVAAGHYQRNRVYANGFSFSAGNAYATGTGSTVYARCDWWDTTDTGAFRVGAASGGVLDASYYLTSDPYSTASPSCTNLIIERAGPDRGSWTTRSGATAGRGTAEDEAIALDRLAEAMSVETDVEAVERLAALVVEAPETGAAMAAVGEVGAIAGRDGAPSSAALFLSDATGSEYASLRSAAWQAILLARRAQDDASGALAAADALALEGAEALVQAEIARVYLHAEAADTTAALAALASLEVLASGSVEAELARTLLGVELAPFAVRSVGALAAQDLGTTVADEVAVTLTVQPNPSSIGTVAVVTIAEPSFVTVTVYDLLGRVVATPIMGPLDAGTHRMPVDVAALAPGVYVMRALVDTAARSTVHSARLTVAR